MGVVIVLLALLAAVVVGALVLLLAGEVAAAAVAVAILGLGVFAVWFAPRVVRGPAAGALLLLFLGGVGYGGFTAYQLTSSMTATAGPVDAADPAALASGNAKIDEVQRSAGFGLDITDAELTAVVQDGLRDVDGPVRAVGIQFASGAAPDEGLVRFTAAFKSGAMSASGVVGYSLEEGRLRTRVQELSLGGLTIPRAARAALNELIEEMADLDSALGDDVTVQSIAIEEGNLVLVGTQRGGKVITSASLARALGAQIADMGEAGVPPAEVLGPGTVNAREAPGSPVYVALGDSLAANVGVSEARDGYVSRFHSALQARDGREYGLRNFGIPGETSGTMLRGQLDEAIAFIESNDVAYVTINIGANDLLPHLASEDCSEGTAQQACAARVEASLAAYEQNLERILSRLRTAAPDVEIVFLQTYNPFSFGFSTLRFEADTDSVTGSLNALAAEVANRPTPPLRTGSHRSRAARR